jgi:hypothetical protein
MEEKPETFEIVNRAISHTGLGVCEGVSGDIIFRTDSDEPQCWSKPRANISTLSEWVQQAEQATDIHIRMGARPSEERMVIHGTNPIPYKSEWNWIQEGPSLYSLNRKCPNLYDIKSKYGVILAFATLDVNKNKWLVFDGELGYWEGDYWHEAFISAMAEFSLLE